MTRTLYPYPSDEEVILAFLRRDISPPTGDTLTADVQRLMCGVTRAPTSILSIAADGSLWVTIPSGRDDPTHAQDRPYYIRVINRVLAWLHGDNLRGTVRRDGCEHEGSPPTLKWDESEHMFTLAGIACDHDRPTLLAGPLGMEAWRAGERT